VRVDSGVGGVRSLRIESGSAGGNMDCRLLYIVGGVRAGGVERQITFLLEALARRGLGPGLVIWSHQEDAFFTDRLKAMGVPYIAFGLEMSALRKLAELRHVVLRQTALEVIHSYSFYTNFAAFRGAWGTHAIAVGALQSDFVSERAAAGPVLGRLSARWPRRVISNNEAAARRAEGANFFRPRVIEVVRNGLDLTQFSERTAPPDAPTFIAVGRLDRDKRLDLLLSAFAVVLKKRPTASLRIVGDGPMSRDYQALAESLGVGASARFLGIRRDIPELLSSSSAFVHPSDIEGCPNAVMEAMACARAVVATDSGDVPHLVEEGASGFVVSRGDSIGLADRMIRLIDCPERCRDMGRAGRRKAEREFGLDRLIDNTLLAYERLGWKRRHLRPEGPAIGAAH
jgi:glycosyltransferase involved in cell wall biosynthesis